MVIFDRLVETLPYGTLKAHGSSQGLQPEDSMDRPSIVSTGSVPPDVIKKYIENQGMA